MAKLSFPELFAIEIEGWRFGLEDNQSTLKKADIFKLLKEIKVVFELAIENLHAFDLIKMSNDFAKASGGIITAKEIAYYIINLLPPEEKLYEEEKVVYNNLKTQVAAAFSEAKNESKSEYLDSFKKTLFA